jgi:hypothetical protein
MINNFKTFVDRADLKGIPWHRYQQILDKYGWTFYINNPVPYMEWQNEYYREKNYEAVGQALIELDFMV